MESFGSTHELRPYKARFDKEVIGRRRKGERGMGQLTMGDSFQALLGFLWARKRMRGKLRKGL